MLSVIILAVAFFLGLAICYSFLTWILFDNLEVKNQRWLTLFCFTFAVSVTLFAFYSIDLLQLDSPEYEIFRHYHVN